jgi:hypothetical protein
MLRRLGLPVAIVNLLLFGLAPLANAASAPLSLPDGTNWCLPSNSSCTDDIWWQVHSERASGRLPTATFVGLDGLKTDPEFAEAIRLLWLWPEGRDELLGAAGRGVQIVEGPRQARDDSDAFATYQESTRTIEIAYEELDTPTWMIADLLAHELRHANDLRKGEDAWDSVAGCFGLEGRAYATERRYMRWLANTFGPLPSADAEQDAYLSDAADELYANLMRIYDSSNVTRLAQRDYADTCTDS